MKHRFDDIPREPLVLLTVTPDHRAYVDGTLLDVPAGTDPRVVAANVAVARARQFGRALRAVLTDAEGRRWPMVLTPEGGVFQATQPLRGANPGDLPTSREEPVVEEDVQSSPPPATNASARPSGDIDPSQVPAWPIIGIVLTEEGKAFVDGSPVREIPGVGSRAAAVAVAAEYITHLGLARPVRAHATDPDGTVWPLLIHPDGTASAAGEPVRTDRSRRWTRRKD